MLIFKKLGGLMQKVFLDTSCYLGFGLNFNNPAFSQLIQLSEEGHIQILTSDIILRELKQNIAKSKNKSLNALKVIEKEYIINNNVNWVEELKESIKNVEENIFKQLKECNLKDINIAELNIQNIMNDYFLGNPPFSNKENKKYEFPDAVILYSIVQYLNGDTCYVISEDDDWKNFCSNYANITFYNRLSSFIDKHVISESSNNPLFEQLRNRIFNDSNFINRCVEDCFNGQDFYHDESVIAEPEIELENIFEITPEESFIIFFDEESKIIEVELYVKIDFSVNIRGYDADCWHKDDDTKEIFYIDGLDNKEILVEESTEKRLNLTIVYDEELNFDIENCIMDYEIVTVGLKDYFC